MLAYIYKTSITETEFYIGSTFNLQERKSEHNKNLHNKNCSKYNYKVYRRLREAGVEVIELEIIYTFECDSDDEKRQMEQDWMDKLSPVLNDKRAYRSEEYTKLYNINWHKKNRELSRARSDEYYKNNTEKVKAIISEKTTCECGGEVRRDSMYRHRRTAKHNKLMLLKNK